MKDKIFYRSLYWWIDMWFAFLIIIPCACLVGALPYLIHGILDLYAWCLREANNKEKYRQEFDKELGD